MRSSLITDLRKAIDGKKTYLVVALGLIYLFGGDQGWWRVSDQVLAILQLLGLGAIRSGVAKAQPPPTPPAVGSPT